MIQIYYPVVRYTLTKCGGADTNYVCVANQLHYPWPGSLDWIDRKTYYWAGPNRAELKDYLDNIYICSRNCVVIFSCGDNSKLYYIFLTYNYLTSGSELKSLAKKKH